MRRRFRRHFDARPLVEALTEAVREALAEGDGETAQVAIRALEELARRIDAPKGTERDEADRDDGRIGTGATRDTDRDERQANGVTDIERARRRLPRNGGGNH
jgi:hypothetical protein